MAHNSFELTPLSPFRLDLTVWTLRRRPHNIVDRWDGTTYRRALELPSGPVEVEVVQSAPPEAARLQIKVLGQPIRAAERAAVKSSLERLLGLSIDLTKFYNIAAQHLRLNRLALRFRGMKPPRFDSVFEGAINAMACQQVTLTLGIHLLNRLTIAYGTALGEGDDAVYAFPLPQALAELSPSDLRQFGFSRQKGRAIIELAESVANGKINLDELATLPDDVAVEHLKKIRGVGRWSAEYILLRGLGRTHIFPGDDVGARNSLQRWRRQAKPLDYDGVRRALSQCENYGGLVYFHLLLDRLVKTGVITELEIDPPDSSAFRARANAGG
jgi:DNA-3-methyladenine glycosylase II